VREGAARAAAKQSREVSRITDVPWERLDVAEILSLLNPDVVADSLGIQA